MHVDPDRVDVDDSGLAWSVAAGYRLNTYIAVEVEYMDFGTSDISEHYVFGPSVVPPFPSEFTNTYSSKVTGPAMSLLGSLPISEDFDVFLRAGVLFADRELGFPPLAGSIELDDKLASTVWLGGAGIDWSFTSRWAIRAEYQRTGKLEKTSFLAGENRAGADVVEPAVQALIVTPDARGVRGPSAPGSDRFGNCSVETPLSRCARSVSGASGQLLSGPVRDRAGRAGRFGRPARNPLPNFGLLAPNRMEKRHIDGCVCATTYRHFGALPHTLLPGMTGGSPSCTDPATYLDSHMTAPGV